MSTFILQTFSMGLGMQLIYCTPKSNTPKEENRKLYCSLFMLFAGFPINCMVDRMMILHDLVLSDAMQFNRNLINLTLNVILSGYFQSAVPLHVKKNRIKSTQTVRTKRVSQPEKRKSQQQQQSKYSANKNGTKTNFQEQTKEIEKILK